MRGKSAASALHTIGCVPAGEEAFVVPAEAAAVAPMATAVVATQILIQLHGT